MKGTVLKTRLPRLTVLEFGLDCFLVERHELQRLIWTKDSTLEFSMNVIASVLKSVKKDSNGFDDIQSFWTATGEFSISGFL